MKNDITFPALKPPATVHATPNAFANNVFSRTTPGISTPFRKHLTCDIPAS